MSLLFPRDTTPTLSDKTGTVLFQYFQWLIQPTVRPSTLLLADLSVDISSTISADPIWASWLLLCTREPHRNCPIQSNTSAFMHSCLWFPWKKCSASFRTCLPLHLQEANTSDICGELRPAGQRPSGSGYYHTVELDSWYLLRTFLPTTGFLCIDYCFQTF